MLEGVHPTRLDVDGQLPGGVGLPIGWYALEKKRGKFPLQFVGEREIQGGGFAAFAVLQSSLGFAPVVVAIVQEENDFAANRGLQPAGRGKLGVKKPSRKKTAGLLAEADDWGGHQELAGFSVNGVVRGRNNWIIRPNNMQAPQPITLYQR